MKATAFNGLRLERLRHPGMAEIWTGRSDSVAPRPADLDESAAAARGFVNAVVLGLIVWQLLALAAWLLV